MLLVWEPHTIKLGLLEGLKLLALRHHTRVCEPSYTVGHVGLVGFGVIRCDRETHNREVFSSSLAKNGVMIRPAGLEVPEQIGRVER